MAKPVQLWMHINDITPTETFWEELDDTKLYDKDAHKWTKQELIDDIREHGFKYQLNVDPNGVIMNGNMRYWIAHYLLTEEDDQRFLYLPVQRNYASGGFHKNIAINMRLPQEQLKQVVEHLALDIHKYWTNYVREETIVTNETFVSVTPDPIDEYRLTSFWGNQRHSWALLYQPHPHPDEKDKMIVYATLGQGTYCDMLKNDIPIKIQNEYKKWYADNRFNKEILDKGFVSKNGKYSANDKGHRTGKKK